MADDNKAVVWFVRFEGTLTGEYEYNDEGRTYEIGEAPYDLDKLYSTREEAQQTATALNRATTRWDEYTGPFFDNGCDPWKLADHCLLPWPQFCDWLKDRGWPRPTIDRVDNGKVVESINVEIVASQLTKPPTLSDMSNWWEVDVVPLFGKEEATLVLSDVVWPPPLYVVESRPVESAAVDELERNLTILKRAMEKRDG